MDVPCPAPVSRLKWVRARGSKVHYGSVSEGPRLEGPLWFTLMNYRWRSPSKIHSGMPRYPTDKFLLTNIAWTGFVAEGFGGGRTRGLPCTTFSC